MNKVYKFAFMRAVQHKTSILIAGFLNGFNLFSFCNTKHISQVLGSLKPTIELSDKNGFQRDAENLSGDWENVKKDIMSSFTVLENELPKATE